jgi:hypothetical protein
MKRDEIARYEAAVPNPTTEITQWEIDEYFEAY